MTQLELENEILDLIDHANEIPRSDLQGIVEVIARKAVGDLQ